MTYRTRARVKAVAAAAVLAAIVATNAADAASSHPADNCQEDEAWTAVSYDDPRGVEDVHGVSRACIPIDDLEDVVIVESCAPVVVVRVGNFR